MNGKYNAKNLNEFLDWFVNLFNTCDIKDTLHLIIK